MKWCAKCYVHLPDRCEKCLYCECSISTTTASTNVLWLLNRLTQLWVCGLTVEEVGDKQVLYECFDELKNSTDPIEILVNQDIQQRFIKGTRFTPREYYLTLSNGDQRPSPMWVFAQPKRTGCGIQQFMVVPDGDEQPEYHSIRYASGYCAKPHQYDYGQFTRGEFECGVAPRATGHISESTQSDTSPDEGELSGSAEPEFGQDFNGTQVATDSHYLSTIYFQGGSNTHCADMHIVRLNNIMHKLHILSTEARYTSAYQNGKVLWTVTRRIRYASHSGVISGKGVGASKKIAEKMILQYGQMGNRDKPTTLESTIVVPRPRLNFSSGKGLSDAQPLRVNPCGATSGVGSVAPTSTLDIARMWGLRSTFKWSNQQPNADLWLASVDPSHRRYDLAYSGTSTPVEYVCGMYQFWSGALEYRFDFSSNAFHTGAVSITIEYGRPIVVGASACHKSSNYMKVFHLGDQRSVHITVPYIYDTIFRRCNGLVYQPNSYLMDEGTGVPSDLLSRALSLRAESKTVIRVSVVNELRPIQSTTQQIDVLVYMRAGISFRVHSLKQMSFRLVQERAIGAPYMDSFPREGYLVTDDKKPSNVTSTTTPARQRRHLAGGKRALPAHIGNRWNEIAADKLK